MTLERFLRNYCTSLEGISVSLKGNEICICASSLDGQFVSFMVRGNELFPFPGPAPKPEPADVSMGNL